VLALAALVAGGGGRIISPRKRTEIKKEKMQVLDYPRSLRRFHGVATD
jgi:hypothetical protein